MEVRFDLTNTDRKALVKAVWAIGLEMDCGHSFAKKYPRYNSIDTRLDRCDAEALKRELQKVYSAQILGNKIFSQWRLYNHWAEGELPDPKWFVIALERFLYLCRKMKRSS